MSGLTERERHLARVVLESCALVTISEADDAINEMMARDGAEVLACLPPAPTLLTTEQREALEQAIIAVHADGNWDGVARVVMTICSRGRGAKIAQATAEYLLVADRRLRGAG